MLRYLRSAVSDFLLGPKFPQQRDLALSLPQDEVSLSLVWGEQRMDITGRHSIASASPFTLCTTFDHHDDLSKLREQKISLELRLRHAKQELLGRLRLRGCHPLQAPTPGIALFGVTSCSNVFIRQRHLAGNRLRQDYWQRRDGKAPNVRLSLLDSHAVMLLFLCPRPVALVTTQREKYMNMFPVNLMGEIGKDMFTLALNSERRAADCVHLAEHIAVSYMPFEMAGLVRQLGANHYKTSIDIGQLPFLTRSSERLGLPVPANATRVLEMRVKASSRLGSHRLFVSDIISDARAGDSPQLCMVHGLYDVAIEAAKNKSS